MPDFKYRAASLGVPDMPPPDAGRSISPISLHNAIACRAALTPGRGPPAPPARPAPRRASRRICQLPPHPSVGAPSSPTGWSSFGRRSPSSCSASLSSSGNRTSCESKPCLSGFRRTAAFSSGVLGAGAVAATIKDIDSDIIISGLPSSLF